MPESDLLPESISDSEYKSNQFMLIIMFGIFITWVGIFLGQVVLTDYNVNSITILALVALIALTGGVIASYGYYSYRVWVFNQDYVSKSQDYRLLAKIPYIVFPLPPINLLLLAFIGYPLLFFEGNGYLERILASGRLDTAKSRLDKIESETKTYLPDYIYSKENILKDALKNLSNTKIEGDHYDIPKGSHVPKETKAGELFFKSLTAVFIPGRSIPLRIQVGEPRYLVRYTVEEVDDKNHHSKRVMKDPRFRRRLSGESLHEVAERTVELARKQHTLLKRVKKVEDMASEAPLPSEKSEELETRIRDIQRKLWGLELEKNDEWIYASAKNDDEDGVRYLITESRIDFDIDEEVDKLETELRNSVEELKNEGDDLRQAALDRRKNSKYEESLDNLDRATKKYERALDVAPAIDKKDKKPGIKKEIEKTQQEKVRTKIMSYTVPGQEETKNLKQNLENRNYENSRKAYRNSLNLYAEAIKIAEEHEFAETADIEGYITQTKEVYLDKVRENIDEAEELTRSEEFESAEGALEDIVGHINQVLEGETDRQEAFEDLRRRAQRGHLEARIKKGKKRIERAEQLFEDSDYYAAREEFDDTSEYLEQVLSLASRYGLTEEKEEIARLVRLCDENMEISKEALYETGTTTPELKSVEDIDLSAQETVDMETAVRRDEDRARAGQGSRGADDSYLTPPGAEVEDTLRRELPEHEVLEWIGSGGNADVHKVRLEETDEIVALKVPRWQGTLSKEVADEFVEEARTWERIDDHENIVSVLDWGTTPYPWMFLEYMDGGSLDEKMDEMNLERRFEVMESVCEAAHHAHTHGVVHADLKPENILLSSDGEVKVGDWGLARVLLQHSGSIEGMTPAYSAPEQIDSDEYGSVDNLSDVYQLGVVAYEVFTGSLPFDGGSHAATINAVLRKEPTSPRELNPDLPEAVNEAVTMALEKRKEDRHRTVVHFRDSLRKSHSSVRDS